MVVGLDISQDFAIPHYSAPNIIYMNGDARSLPFIQQFDKVTAFLSLNWVYEQDQALNSIYAALKPHGKAIIVMPGKQASNLGPIVEILVKKNDWVSYFPDYENKKIYYTAKEYQTLLEKAGFIVEKVSEYSTYTYFKNRSTLIRFFRPICTFLRPLSSELQERFLNEIVDEVLKTNPASSDGSILLHDFKLEAIILKL